MLDDYFLEIIESDFTVATSIGSVEILQGTSPTYVEAITAVEIIEAGGVGGAGLTTGSVIESMLAPSFLRHIEAIIVWNGTGSQPLRSVATGDSLRPVRWRQPTAPPFTSGYAIAGLDVWEQTP